MARRSSITASAAISAARSCVVVMPITAMPAARAASIPAGASSHTDASARLGSRAASPPAGSPRGGACRSRPRRRTPSRPEPAGPRRAGASAPAPGCPDVTIPQLPAGRRASNSSAPRTISSPSVSSSSSASSASASASASTCGATARIVSTLRTPCRIASTDGKSRPRRAHSDAPLPLDDHPRIHERAVEVEEQRRRHTSMRAASRATPNDACSTSPRSSPSACSGSGRTHEHAHVVHVVEVGEQLVRAARLAAGDEELRRIARQMAPPHVAGHDHVEPALERRERGELERERPEVAPGMHVGREDAHAVRDDPVAETDVELWLAEVAAQQRAHDLRREVGVARPLAPRPPPVVDEADGLGVGADAGGEREAPAVDDAEVDAALASRDERLRHDLGGGSEVARHAQRARQHARPAGRQDAHGKRVARAVEHLVGGAVASHRNDAVEAHRRRPPARARSRARGAGSRSARRRTAAPGCPGPCAPCARARKWRRG